MVVHTVVMVTNRAFGSAIGVTESYASYLRNGERKPSGDLLVAIIQKYELDPLAAMIAYVAGAKHFGAYLRQNIFDVPASDEPSPAPEDAPTNA